MKPVEMFPKSVNLALRAELVEATLMPGIGVKATYKLTADNADVELLWTAELQVEHETLAHIMGEAEAEGTDAARAVAETMGHMVSGAFLRDIASGLAGLLPGGGGDRIA